MQSGFGGSCCSVGSSTIFKIGSLSERLMSKQDSDFRLDLPRDRFVNSGFGIGSVSFLSSLLIPVGFALFFLLLVNFFTLTTHSGKFKSFDLKAFWGICYIFGHFLLHKTEKVRFWPILDIFCYIKRKNCDFYQFWTFFVTKYRKNHYFGHFLLQ